MMRRTKSMREMKRMMMMRKRRRRRRCQCCYGSVRGLRYQTTQCEHYSWWHRTSSLLPWMCFKVKNWKKKMSCVPQKNQTCCKKFFLVNCCSLNKCTVFTRIIAAALIKFFCTSSAVLNRRQRLFKNWKLQRNLVLQFNGISSICTKSYSYRSVFPLSPFSSFKLCGIPWISATSGKRR